ncbi:MAG: SDR family oxidoreductase [Bacteroidota bacterium]
MNLDLNGKSALVGGSTQGIGKAIAIELALLGAEVTLLARNQERLKEILEELDTSNRQSHSYLCADFEDVNNLENLVKAHLEEKGKAEILINNTGGPPAGLAIDANADQFVKAFSNHLLCNQALTQATVPFMKKAGYGRIINIISTSVKSPIPGLGVSNTIRGAVANWAKTLSIELASFGITVNNVLPGMTKTQRLDAIVANKAQKAGLEVDEMAEQMMNDIPAKRFADADEVAAAAAFLASPAAAYINGINLPVDGGRLSNL